MDGYRTSPANQLDEINEGGCIDAGRLCVTATVERNSTGEWLASDANVGTNPVAVSVSPLAWLCGPRTNSCGMCGMQLNRRSFF